MLGITAKWFLQTLLAAVITMFFIYGIKKFTSKVNVPVVSEVAAQV